MNFLKKNESINAKTLYLIPSLDTRKNFDNLKFYKVLHEKKIIKNILFEKDNYSSIIKKLERKRNLHLKFKNSQTLNLNVFNMNLFEINNLDNFFLQAKTNYEYVSIQENGYSDLDIYNYIKKNFQKINKESDDLNLNYNNGLRDIIRYIYKGGDVKNLDNFILGNNYSLYKFN